MLKMTVRRMISARSARDMTGSLSKPPEPGSGPKRYGNSAVPVESGLTPRLEGRRRLSRGRRDQSIQNGFHTGLRFRRLRASRSAYRW